MKLYEALGLMCDLLDSQLDFSIISQMSFTILQTVGGGCGFATMGGWDSKFSCVLCAQ